MMVGLLVAGIGLVVAGLLAVGFGIPVKEFSLGSTLILTGVTAVCSGAIVIGLSAVVKELKNLSARLGAGLPAGLPGPVVVPSLAAALESRIQIPAESGFPEVPEPAPATGAGGAPSPPAWLGEAAARDRPPMDAAPEPDPAEVASTAKPRRNLLFSSTSRKERERAQARTGESLPPEMPAPEPRPEPSVAPPPVPPPPQATFDDAWPKADRSRPADLAPPRRNQPTFNEPESPINPPPRSQEQPQVTVLKSGVVDGMGYSLYSDGSIEAQMPEGMMRFASIDELRTHLEQRP